MISNSVGLEHPTRSRRIVGSNSILGSEFFPSFHFMQKNVSYFKIKTFYLSDAKYPTDNPSQMNNPSLGSCHRDTFCFLHIAPPPPPPPPSTSKQFVENGQKLVQTREMWKIQGKGNNVLAGRRKRVLVQKTRLLATFLSIHSVVTV